MGRKTVWGYENQFVGKKKGFIEPGGLSPVAGGKSAKASDKTSVLLLKFRETLTEAKGGTCLSDRAKEVTEKEVAQRKKEEGGVFQEMGGRSKSNEELRETTTSLKSSRGFSPKKRRAE